MVRIRVINPSGNLVTIPSEKLPAAIEAGYRPATDADKQVVGEKEEYTDIGSTIGAGLAGAARGLTFGLSDVAFTGTGLIEPETLQKYRQYSPEASFLGELGGIGLSLLTPVPYLGVGVRGVAKVGKAVETGFAQALRKSAGKSLASKIVKTTIPKAAGSAVEGAFYGAGQLISEQALSDPELTAEKVISHIGINALFSGTTSAALGLAGKGVQTALGSAVSKIPKAKKFLQEVSDTAFLKAALGQQKRAYVELESRNLMKKAASLLRKKIIKPGDTVEDIANKLNTEVNRLGKELDKTVLDLDQFYANPRYRKYFVDPIKVANKMAKWMKKKIGPAVSRRQLRDFAMEEIHHIDMLAGPGQRLRMPFARVKAERAGLQERVNKFFDTKDRQKVLKAYAEIWNKEADAAAIRFFRRLGRPDDYYRKLRHEFSLTKTLRDFAVNRTLGNISNRRISPSDYGMGVGGGLGAGLLRSPDQYARSAAPSMTGAFARGLGFALGNKFLRERGNTFLGAAADRLIRLEKTAARTTSMIKRKVDRFAKREPGHLVAPTVSTILNDFEGGREEDRKKFKKLVTRIERFNQNPSQSAELIAEELRPLSEVYPAVADQMGITILKAVNFLGTKIPKKPYSASLPSALGNDWNPSDSDMIKFAKYAGAVQNPLSVLDDLERGNPSREGIDVLQQIYPKLYSDIKRALMYTLSDKKDKLHYADRINLGLVFGVNLDPTAQPYFMDIVQRNYSDYNNQEMQEQQQSRAPVRISALQKSKAVSRSMTNSERIATKT